MRCAAPVLLAVGLVAALTGMLSASASAADPEPAGPRDGKSRTVTAEPAHDHDHDRPADVDIASILRVAAVQATCAGGVAGGYPCRNVDLLSNLPLASIGGGSSWRQLSVHNNHAYIVSDNNGAHGMQIFNLTRLRGVTTPQTFTADARNTSFNNGHTVHINNATGIAYVNGSNTCSGGSRMFSLANPISPTFVGCVSGDGYTHDAQAVVYRGPHTAFAGHEILMASNEDTLTVWDVTNKSAPVQLARRTYTGRGYTHQGWFTENQRYFVLDDETDETSRGHATRTYVWDMADLTNPVMIGTYSGPTAASDHNQFVKGNYSYQATYRAGLR